MIIFEKKKLVFFVLLCLFSTAKAFTEAEAIQIALENNPEIKISAIALSRDSLDLKKVQADAFLQAQISGDKIIEVHPATRNSYSGADTVIRTLETGFGGTVSHHIPGGGNVSTSVESWGTRDLDSSGANFTTYSGLTVTQPLLKDAWSNAPIDYQISIEKKNLNITFEKFKDDILDILSRVREAYLDWLSSVHAVEIRKAELEYTRNALDYEKARFQLGEKAEMDTLAATLELLRARENLMSAEYGEKTARKRFSLELGIDTGELPELSDSSIQISPIPSADAIMVKVKENNYQLKLIELTKELLELQHYKHKNSLLPRVDVSAGVQSTQRGSNFFSSNSATAANPNVIDPWIGITFTYDILARKERYSKKQAELSLQSNEIEKTYFINQQRVAVGEFVDAWAQDSAKLNIRSAEVIIAEKNHNYAVERYQLGEIDNLTKLKAQSDLINAKLNKLFAEVNLKRLEIAVDKATANVFNRFGVTLK